MYVLPHSPRSIIFFSEANLLQVSGKDVTIWATAEPAAAIIAASIPVLRVFVKAKASTGRYGSSKKTGTGTTKNDVQLSRITNTHKAASGLHGSQRGNATWVTTKADDGSDKSILHEEENVPASGIVQTSTFLIEYPEDSKKFPESFSVPSSLLQEQSLHNRGMTLRQ
jgi:hypothetical protein